MPKLLLSFLFAVACVLCSAQPGTLDAVFNAADNGQTAGAGANGAVHAIAVQGDGKILIGGAFTTYNGYTSIRVARLGADGSIDDASFGVGSGANGPVQSISIERNGLIYIGGSFTDYKGYWYRDYLVQVNSSGGIEANFAPGNGANGGDGATGAINAVALQGDGKLIIGGTFNFYNNVGRNFIARINPDGSLDASFDPGTGANNSITSVVLQPDGKVLIGGDFTTYNGVPAKHLARLNSDGSLDASFSTGVGASSAVSAVALQQDGKILIGGSFTFYNGVAVNKLARLHSNGTLDVSFNTGSGVNGAVQTILLQGDGKILIGGAFTTYNGTERGRIARLRTNGGLDNSFDPGVGANNSILTMVQQGDGKILIGGHFTAYSNTNRKYITRLNEDGSLDAGFNRGWGANNTVQAVLPLGGGSMLIGGDFTTYNGSTRNHLAIVGKDGSLGAQLGAGTNNTVRTITAQQDGYYLIGGDFTTFNGTTRNRIARIETAGYVDAFFNPGKGANATVYAIAVQKDSAILIGGAFTTYRDTARARIARLKRSGALDSSFDPGTGANDIITAVALQKDGKIVIGGYFTSFNGTGRNYLARLQKNGSLDASFNTGAGPNARVESITIQADGKILIGGQFTAYGGAPRQYIARLNTDGSLDADFNPDGSTNGSVHTIVLQADGKILIGGSFTQYSGTARNYIAQLHPDGRLDASFDAGTAFNNSVRSVGVQNDGTILVGGQFTTHGGTGRSRIARLLKGSSPLLLGAVSPGPYCAGSEIKIPFTATGNFTGNYGIQVVLSDTAGSFLAGKGIQNYTAATTGFISDTIRAITPFEATAGSGYRVRLEGWEEEVVSIDNGTNLTIKALPDTPKVLLTGAAAFCQGSSVVLTSTATAGNQWYKDSVLLGGATDPALAVNQIGKYSVTTTANGCTSLMSPQVGITVMAAPPKPVITQNGSILISSAASGNQWYFNDMPIPGATGKQYTAQAAGLYTVQVTQGGCSTLSDALNFTTTAIVDPRVWNEEVIVYPNPVQDRLYVTNTAGRRLHVQVLDLVGKKIMELQFAAASASLMLKEVAAGTYVLLITDVRKSETITRTIVKQ